MQFQAILDELAWENGKFGRVLICQTSLAF